MYTDKYGRYHNIPTDGVEPSSNNGWIYTAYAVKLGLPVDLLRLKQCYAGCRRSMLPMIIDRSPGKQEPPISRDEIIGLASLGLLTYAELKANYFQYYNPDSKAVPWYKINWIKAIKALWYLKDKHRNTVWEEEVKDAYPIAFRLAPWDVYYIKSLYGIKTNWLEKMFFNEYLKEVSHSDDVSAKNIATLQMEDLGMKDDDTLLIVEKDFNYIDYFGENHIFNKGE